MDQEYSSFIKKTYPIYVKSLNYINGLERNFKRTLKNNLLEYKNIDKDIIEELKRISLSMTGLEVSRGLRTNRKKDPVAPEDWDTVGERIGNAIVKPSARFYWENRPKENGKVVPTSYDTLPPEYALPYGLNILGGNIILDNRSPW